MSFYNIVYKLLSYLVISLMKLHEIDQRSLSYLSHEGSLLGLSYLYSTYTGYGNHIYMYEEYFNCTIFTHALKTISFMLFFVQYIHAQVKSLYLWATSCRCMKNIHVAFGCCSYGFKICFEFNENDYAKHMYFWHPDSHPCLQITWRRFNEYSIFDLF